MSHRASITSSVVRDDLADRDVPFPRWVIGVVVSELLQDMRTILFVVLLHQAPVLVFTHDEKADKAQNNDEFQRTDRVQNHQLRFEFVVLLFEKRSVFVGRVHVLVVRVFEDVGIRSDLKKREINVLNNAKNSSVHKQSRPVFRGSNFLGQ